MGTWDNNAVGIDTAYNVFSDWDTIAKNVDFIIAKCSEGTDIALSNFASTCQGAYDHNIPFGAFHYYTAWYYLQFPYDDLTKWPAPDKDLQLQNMVHQLEHKEFQFLAIDLEHADNVGVAPNWFSRGAEVLVGRAYDWMAVNHPGKPLFVYSSNEFIKQYAPNINNWIAKYNSWIAQWYWNAGNVNTTWEGLKNFYPDDGWKFGYFSTRPTWEMEQWSGDRFHLPGLTGAVDVDFFNGDVQAFKKFVGYVDHDVTPPPPPPAPVGIKKHTIGIMNERSYAAVANNVVGSRPAGAAVNYTDFVTQNGYTWGRTAEGTWIAIAIGSHPYVE